MVLNIGVLYTRFSGLSRKVNRVHAVFSKSAEQHGIKLFFAPYTMYKNGKLVKSLVYNKKRWSIAENQSIDFVYSRFARSMYLDNKENKTAIQFKHRLANETPVLNHPFLDRFCWDKRIVSEMFPEFSPKTFLVNTLNGLKNVLPELKTDKIVIKPRYGSLGTDVLVLDKRNLPEDICKNSIVQEFIETSAGIPGVVDKRHDLRIVMIDGEIDHAHVRIPKRGMLVANVAKGGKKVFISKDKIPSEAIEIAKKIDALFSNYSPRLYSVDFLFDKNHRPYIVECNSQPMIDKYAFGKWKDLSFYDRMFNCMKKGIKLKIEEQI